MSEIVCAYDNCEEIIVARKGFKCTITESSDGVVWDRQSFCCYEHGWRWLKRRDEKMNHVTRMGTPSGVALGAAAGSPGNVTVGE